MKKSSNFYMKYIAIISLVLVAFGGFYAIKAMNSMNSGESVAVEKDNPHYSLRKNATEYQREIYKELSDAFRETPLNQEKISGLVVKNYVADFYTWTNKLRFNDVGGIQYLHEDVESWVNAQALETFYNNMNYYLTNGGLEDTLEIKDVQVKVTPITFEYNDEEVDAFSVDTKWQYVASNKLDIADYQDEAQFTLIADSEGLFTIVEVLELEEE